MSDFSLSTLRAVLSLAPGGGPVLKAADHSRVAEAVARTALVVALTDRLALTSRRADDDCESEAETDDNFEADVEECQACLDIADTCPGDVTICTNECAGVIAESN